MNTVRWSIATALPTIQENIKDSSASKEQRRFTISHSRRTPNISQKDYDVRKITEVSVTVSISSSYKPLPPIGKDI